MILWAFWHLPAFFYNYELELFGLLGFLVGLLAGTVLLNWLYNSTDGSLLVVILWPGSYNAPVAGAQPAGGLIVTFLGIFIAISIVRRLGPEDLSTWPKQTMECA